MVPTAVAELKGSGVKVASVATASGRPRQPRGQARRHQGRRRRGRRRDRHGDRSRRIPGRPLRERFDQIVAVKTACGNARLKVILETGELATYDNVRRASWLALLAGADFIKTSTGKISPAATLPVVHVMLQAVKDWKAQTGEQRAVKPAGGIRTAKDAIRYLVAVHGWPAQSGWIRTTSASVPLQCSMT